MPDGRFAVTAVGKEMSRDVEVGSFAAVKIGEAYENETVPVLCFSDSESLGCTAVRAVEGQRDQDHDSRGGPRCQSHRATRWWGTNHGARFKDRTGIGPGSSASGHWRYKPDYEQA